MADATKKTLIEEGTELKGTVNSTCPIVVMGRVEGDLTGPSVEVTESGVLSGKAKVTELRSRGELAGQFEADIVELAGKVRDKTAIRARSLQVTLDRTGGSPVEVVFGDCELMVGDAPDKAKAVAGAQPGERAKLAAAAVVAPAPAELVVSAAPAAPILEEASGRNGHTGKKAVEAPQSEGA